MWIVMFLLGIGGGMTSTIVGFGGGMVLSLALALAVSPLAALAVASVALVSGSIHRVFLYRHSLEAADSYRWAAAIAIGGLCGGMIAHHLPDLLIRVAFLAAVVATLLPRRKALAVGAAPPRAAVLVPAGGAIGFLGAATAGVGPLASSTLLATGHVGDRYIALMSVTGVALNAGRILGYGSSGALQPAWLGASILAGAGLLAGNLLGRRVRHLIPPRHMRRLERVLPWLCLVMAVAGLFSGGN